MFRAIGSLAFVVALCIPLVSRGEDDPRLSKLRTVWLARQQATRTALVKWDEVDVQANRDQGPKLAKEARQLTSSMLLGRGNLMRYERGSDLSTFDGVRTNHFTAPQGPNDYPRGIVRADETWNDLQTLHFIPVLIHYRPLFEPFPGLASDGIAIKDENAKVGDRVCTLIETKPINGASRLYWVDVERDCIVLQYQDRAGGRVACQLDINYKQAEDGAWILKSWAGAFTNGAVAMKAAVIEQKLDPPAIREHFQLSFAPGTMVFDQNLGKRWLELPDGRKRVITNEESMNGFDYQELLESADDGLGPKQSE